MQTVENGDNTQRVISNNKLIDGKIKPRMPRKKKIVLGVVIFIAIAAIVGTVVGLYYYFSPGANHILTTVSTTDNDESYSSTEFDYFDINMVGDSVQQRFTLMAAGLNGANVPQQQAAVKRNLQINDTIIVPDVPILDDESNRQSGNSINVDVTLHYTHQSGIQIKFRGNEVLKISVPIDQVVEYIAQQEDPTEYARLLQDLTQYDGEDEVIQGQDIFDHYRTEVQESLQALYNNTGSKFDMIDLDIYELDYDENSGSYKYSNASEISSRRRLWRFRNFFHKIGNFVKKTAGDVVHLVKKDGPKILKYGAIAALAGIDIAAKGPSGISDAVKMFKSGNVLTALEMTAEGVATKLPPYLSVPIEFIGQACFSHPPKMHCTKEAALKAAKQDVVAYVKKHAVSTVLSLME